VVERDYYKAAGAGVTSRHCYKNRYSYKLRNNIVLVQLFNLGSTVAEEALAAQMRQELLPSSPDLTEEH